MKESAVAIRYARALAASFEKTSILERVNIELSEVATLLEDNLQLRGLMLNPVVPLSVKQKTVGKIVSKAKYKKETGRALNVIVENGRVSIIKSISEEFEKLVFDSLGRVRVKVKSAVKLSTGEMQSLKKKLKKITGKEAVVEMKIDASLIGGVVAQVGSVVYDGSIRCQLAALRIKT